MPKEDHHLNEKNDKKEQTAEEIAAQDERFRKFFSTSVVEVPAEMNRRDAEPPKRSWLDRLFHREKASPEAAQAAPEEKPQEMPTGEISLTAPPNEPPANLELAWEPAQEEAAPAEPTKAEQPAPQPPREEPKAAPQPEPAPEPHSAPASPKQQETADERTVWEQREDEEMQELKAMLYQKPAKPQDPTPAAPEQNESVPPESVSSVPVEKAEEEPTASQQPDEESAQPAAQPPETAPAAPVEEVSAAPEETAGFRVREEDDEATPQAVSDAALQDGEIQPQPDEESQAVAPEGEAPAEEGTAPPAEAPEKADETADAEAAPAEGEAEASEPAQATEPETPEQVGERLRRMSATLTLRCVLSGILAVVLLHFGLVAEGLLAPSATLDPALAPSAFYAANLLFYAAALCVAYPVLRDGLSGLRGRPSADTMPALAACAALIEASIALLNAANYHNSSFTLLTGIAGLGLFLNLLGSRVMLAAIQSGYELAVREGECQGAYRVRNKDLIRTLARSLDQNDPWILRSLPTEWSAQLMEQSFGERASEKRTRKTSYILLGVALLSGLAFLLFGGGINGAAAASTAMLCMGAPLSSTLIAGLASLRLQRAAGAVGAAVPGWAAIEELGGVDTIQVDTDDLFAPDSATLEDIRIFKGGRIDRVILYAASILNLSCGTLRGMFRQIVEDRTDILYPVKDFEFHRGLGFSAWCDNNRVLIGNRAYMAREGVELPEKDYEEKHSKNGSLQILYLAVSGSLHAMFILRYVGTRSVAHGLDILQKENIRLLVSCGDPSLTAKHITEAYHLPEGMITLLDQGQCDALAARPDEADPAEAAPAHKEVCCMLFNKGFTSLTGGLRAAEQAQNAETTATTVQLVSVWFSVAIGVLLTYAGSIGFLSVAAVLMYQAAWSALSLAVCALKQHN